MNQNNNVYQWSRRDKLLYFITLIPFLVAFIGTAYLLATISIYLTIIVIILYLIANFFQAGCCVGCPYRGKYCPALLGVYLANFISSKIYANRQFDPKFFKINATIAEIFVVIILLFSGFWLLTLSWIYPVLLLILITVHFALFFIVICPKCSYHSTCPGGKTACMLFKKKCEKYDVSFKELTKNVT